ncbi:ATP-binding protein [Kiritimatiellaeota bacterium B1221]|nr:ATP-binding protein [Kiritimatiellaeota bacterium B1221]
MQLLKRYRWSLLSFIGISLLFVSAYCWEARQLQEQLIQENQERARITDTVLNAQISQLVQLLHSFSLQKKIPDALRYPDAPLPTDLVDMAKNLMVLNNIDQFRLILPNGDERLRVDDHGHFAGKEDLQNKYNRDYFQEAIQLPPGSVYISKFDLNMEHQKLESPINPTIRLSNTIQGSDGNPLGLMVMNIKLTFLFQELKNLYPDISPYFHMLNEQGFFLIHPNPQFTWGQYFPDRAHANLKKRNPDLWNEIISKTEGFQKDSEGITIWRKVKLNVHKDNQLQIVLAPPYKLVLLRIPKPVISARLAHLRIIALASYCIFSCALIALYWLFAERRQALKIAEEAFDHAAIGMSLLKTDGTFIKVNHAMTSLIGYPGSNLIGRNFAELTHPEDLKTCQNLVKDLLAHNIRTFEVEKRYLHSNGKEIWVLQTATLVQNTKGAPLYIISQTRDLSDRILHEHQLLEANESLERSNRELEQFAYVASHDLQEPLRMVSSYTQLLAQRYEGQLDEKADKYIAYAVDGAKRMQTLINDLLSYSRVGTGNESLQPVDCESVIRDLKQTFSKLLDETQTELTTTQLPVVQARRTELTQVFQNLIHNAIKFSGAAPPQVEISARRDQNHWLISVKDHGIGIDPQYHERIFTIFQRLHKRDSYQGSGIGLSIVKKIVEDHGGRIQIESQLNQGATFTFSFPAA